MADNTRRMILNRVSVKFVAAYSLHSVLVLLPGGPPPLRDMNKTLLCTAGEMQAKFPHSIFTFFNQGCRTHAPTIPAARAVKANMF